MIVQNQLLAACAADSLALRPLLTHVELATGAVLERPGQNEQHVWFIESGVASVVVGLDAGTEVEPLQIGREGFCGFGAVLGNTGLSYSTVMRVGGAALRAEGARLRTFLRDRPFLRGHLLRCVHAVQRRLAQETHCVGRHALSDRLASRLLALSEQLGSNTIPMTHDALAAMLGSRRVSVSTAMRQMQENGLLTQQWGGFTLHDKEGIAAQSCSCHVGDTARTGDAVATAFPRTRVPAAALGGGTRRRSHQPGLYRGHDKAGTV
jgi:CRP-like cAMP-binding protein